jgi:hypothetical protein
MPLPRRYALPVTADRPTWLTAGTLRLATLAVFIVAVGMIRTHLTHGLAWTLVGIGAGVAAAGVAVLLGATKRLERHLAIPWASEAFVLVLRRVGLPLLGLAFFLAWTLAYVALWAHHPNAAFRGLPASPRFADFFYYAVSTAFISPPGDVLAHSRGARSATMIEMLTAFALLTAYLSSFVDWHQQRKPSVGENLG